MRMMVISCLKSLSELHYIALLRLHVRSGLGAYVSFSAQASLLKPRVLDS